ncbi:hypothetical protein D5086_000937 [Populus alba]|uniref:Uncharacterized protein n=1 Tax=Populus alba TaxID=43335 RepID=A0ACC4CX93_POPAL
MSNIKLGVEVVSAHNLLPKDEHGSSSAFVELDFDGQRFRTTIKEKDLNPVWNESFYFNVSDPSNLHYLTLDAHVYCNIRATNSRSFLGKVCLTGNSFVLCSDAVVLHYPLEKRGIFSRVRGELGLKVYITDDASIKSSTPLPAVESLPTKDPGLTHTEAPVVHPMTNSVPHRRVERHTFHHLPNPNHQQNQHQNHSSAPASSHHVPKYVADEMKAAETQPPKLVRMYSASSSQPVDYALKETSPFLGGGRVVGGRVIHGDKTASTYDLVERMYFLYVRVVKARDLPAMDVTGSLDPFVEDKDLLKDDFVGFIRFDINEVPLRVPPDSPLAPEWIIHSCWFNLEKPVAVDVDQLKKDKFSSRLHPMKTRDGRGTSDTYCVAKYGHKWVRTRTLIDNLSPKYNEQYTWEVFDPATVLTVGVFDNNQLGEKGSSGKDLKIGKVRIRISTLETGRVYTHSYPLLVLHPTGVKKMGELHLAIRFTCVSFANMLYQYSRPLLPKMHYIRPFTVMQLDMLRHQAVNIVALRLGRAEPPLRKEVVEYMSDVDAHLWSMRRSKANFFRLMTIFSGLFAAGKWFGDICMWKNPITTVLVHVLYLMLACFPELILPTVFLYMFLIGIWNYRYRPRYPPHMNTKISQAEVVHPDELDEEFDTFPTSRSPELVRMRYDRLRSVSGRIQTVLGDIATQGERFQALLSWRDPRATAIFVIFCLVAALVLFVTPFQVIAALAGFYMMRHPRFRYRTPSVPINFFRRLPSRTDSML